MESTRFDRLTRALGAFATRRAAMGLVTALGLTGVIPPDGGARRRRKKTQKCRRCGFCQRCRKGRCRPKPDGAPCRVCATCQNGQCVAGCPGQLSCQNNVCGCPPGQKVCAEACIPENECCGACPESQTCCTNVGECKDLRNDADFCGQCASGQCPGGAFCANGACGLTCTAVTEICFQPDCRCSRRVDPEHADELVCAGISPFHCGNVPECETDADCAPATAGFRQVCVSSLCPDKDVCADPCA